MTTLSSPTSQRTAPRRRGRVRTAARVVGGAMVAGAAAGALVGVVARVWMRLLAEDPEFTMSATMGIVVVFAVCGLGHAVAHVARRRASGRVALAAARTFAGVTTLPLFGGAGVIMFPTVLGASLAVWRRAWPRGIRAVALLVAVPAPLVLVADVVRIGVTPARVLGLVLLAATYSLVVWSTGAIVAPVARRRDAGPRDRSRSVDPAPDPDPNPEEAP